MANIFETARADRRASKFSKGLDSAAGLAQTLSGPGPFTIFVPTDAAFDKLSVDQQNKLLGDPGKLTKLVKYHIVPGLYTAYDMLDQIFLKTLEGPRLRVWADIYETPLGEGEMVTGSDAYGYIVQDTVTTAMQESIEINGAHVLLADVRADNGIMHLIDKVLVPPFMVL
jgi:uncharacterized surface protein with fasciclin (FAS1) repeats